MWLRPAIVFSILLLGCGGGGLAGNVYRSGPVQYRIGELGPNWQRVGVQSNDLAWHNPSLEAVVQVNATCDPGNDVPLSALTNHLLIGFTARENLDAEVFSLDGREALRSHVRARLDGVPRELLFVVLKKDDCIYDFALVTPPGDPFASARPEFESFVNGFSTRIGS